LKVPQLLQALLELLKLQELQALLELQALQVLLLPVDPLQVQAYLLGALGELDAVGEGYLRQV
jgi:hypothetical protein